MSTKRLDEKEKKVTTMQYMKCIYKQQCIIRIMRMEDVKRNRKQLYRHERSS